MQNRFTAEREAWDRQYGVTKLRPKTKTAKRMVDILEVATLANAPKLVKVRRKMVTDDTMGDDPADCVVVGKRFATFDTNGYFIGPIWHDAEEISLYDAVQYLIGDKTWLSAFKNRNKPNPISDYDLFIAKRLTEVCGTQVTARSVANWVGEDGAGVGYHRVDKLVRDVLGPKLYSDAEVSARMMNVIYAVLNGQKTIKIGGVTFKNLDKRPDAKYQNTHTKQEAA